MSTGKQIVVLAAGFGFCWLVGSVIYHVNPVLGALFVLLMIGAAVKG